MEFKKNYPKILLFIYLVIWIWAAIEPKYRSVWVDENIMPVLFIILFVISYRWFKFSNTSYTLIFVFMVLHAIGGHYSYAEMPLFDYLKGLYGLSRNHYDRIIHFLFGVLFFLPVYEFLNNVFYVPKGWRAFMLSFFVIIALKGGFENIEYWYVWVKADPLTVTNYLGEQGDSWDSQKDVFLGIVGAGISWVIAGIKRVFRQV